jgi:hypothetical protein
MPRAADANEFCLVLSPDFRAGAQARHAVQRRFPVLGDETRTRLGAVVADLVETSVERRPGRPITVTIAVGAESIRGEVADQGGFTEFEIPLAG